VKGAKTMKGKKALLSVYDKTGIVELASELVSIK
jgi:AICAR transformylase/IMP cyclohydrolase PurH